MDKKTLFREEVGDGCHANIRKSGWLGFRESAKAMSNVLISSHILLILELNFQTGFVRPDMVDFNGHVMGRFMGRA